METTTGERPVLFSGPMIRAILAGTKTQTRRVVQVRGGLDFIGGQGEKNNPGAWGYFFDGPDHHGWMVLERGRNERHDNGCISIPCPLGEVGDHLWVRETHSFVDRLFDGYDREDPTHVAYQADLSVHEHGAHRRVRLDAGGLNWDRVRWRPSIHMPRWASRLTLEVTGVRVERLGDITNEDARAEGVEPWDGDEPGDYRGGFRETWEGLYGAESWDASPWVWVVSFRRIETTTERGAS